MKYRTFLIALVGYLYSTMLLAGGGWPQPAGHGYIKLSEWWLIADQHYTDVGRIDPNLTTGIFNTSFYAEYGLSNRLTGLLNFPLFSRAYVNNQVSFTTGEVLIPGEAINSVGDLDIGLMYGLWAGNGWSISARLVAGIPLGIDDGGTAGNLQTGDGEFNQLLQVDVGKSFQIGSLPAYANIYTGVNNRSGGFSDEYRFGLEAGLSFLQDRLTTTLRLYGVQSFHNGLMPSAQANSTSIFANNSEHITFAPEISYRFSDHWGIAVGMGQALSGRIVLAAPAYTIGIFVSW